MIESWVQNQSLGELCSAMIGRAEIGGSKSSHCMLREMRRLWIAVVNRVPVYICINYFFVLSLTVEKAHVGRKIALASVHRLAEHLHAMSTQKSRYKISDYSQARSSVPPKIPLMYLLFESWTVGSCRFQIHLCVHSCMRNEPWIRTRFSHEISTSSVSLNLM